MNVLLPRLSFLVSWLCMGPLFAQAPQDTVRLLSEITVQAYQANRDPVNIPASIGVVQTDEFNRFSTASLLPAFNMLPGIRMEERSPGSYRFSIRGSLLRSPFGVRNVKFYWNGLPFTDGGGNTYLNLIDLNGLNDAEVIKGPAGSLYGAGTGGAVLLRSPIPSESAAGLLSQYGSYGTLRIGADLATYTDNTASRIQFVRQQADGYREQSRMWRNAFQGDIVYTLEPATLMHLTVLSTDLYYQTPGGLTESQYLADPQQARPSSPAGPGAVEQKASVTNRTTLGGMTLEHQWSHTWSTTLGAVFSRSQFENAAIRNYEVRDERNIGARLTTTYEKKTEALAARVVAGGEYQRLESPITVTDNIGGTPGTLLISSDQVTSSQGMAFLQGEVEWPVGWQAVGGVSVNFVHYTDVRSAPPPASNNSRAFTPQVMPRIAILRKVSPSANLFVSASRGFSPPTVAELIPSTGVYNNGLSPESGWSYEAGVSGTVKDRLTYHLALYDFRLTNAIVLQRDSSGADYYVNAGDTRQQGVEGNASWMKSWPGFTRNLKLTLGFTYSHFRFGTYINDGNDYSGNPLTGVPPWVLAFGADIGFRNGLYAQLTGNYADRIPLNDASTDFASDYFLLGVRTGIRLDGALPIDIYAGADNVLNQSYSLGNDLNAAGKRYFNPAPPVNFYVGLIGRLPIKLPE